MRFLVVDINATSTTTRVNYKTTRTTTVTTEKFSGADRYIVCNRCLGQKKRSNAIGLAVVGLLGGFVAGILIFAMIDYFSCMLPPFPSGAQIKYVPGLVQWSKHDCPSRTILECDERMGWK